MQDFAEPKDTHAKALIFIRKKAFGTKNKYFQTVSDSNAGAHPTYSSKKVPFCGDIKKQLSGL